MRMEHISLYRKWRPQLFGDVIGQPHVTNTLANRHGNAQRNADTLANPNQHTGAAARL